MALLALRSFTPLLHTHAGAAGRILQHSTLALGAQAQDPIDLQLNAPQAAPYLSHEDAATFAAGQRQEAAQQQQQLARPALPAPSIDFDNYREAFKGRPTSTLLRGYAVLKACTFTSLVRNADKLVALSRRTLGDTITYGVIKHTMFKYFCAGEDDDSIRPVIDQLRSNGIRPIVDYAAEDDEDAAADTPDNTTGVVGRTYSYEDEQTCDRHLRTFHKAIDTVANLGVDSGFAAIKMTALGNPRLLERMADALVEIRGLFQAGDTSGDNFVDLEEFRALHQQLFPHADDASVRRAFATVDLEGRGKVDMIDWCNRIKLQHMPSIVERIRRHGGSSELAEDMVECSLQAEEVQLAEAMLARTMSLGQAAAEKGVKLMIDAEHTYFQPAIDHTAKALMGMYNRDKPIIFNTYQCYLKGSHERLLEDIERARREGYHMAAKLVRGAYMQLERERALDRGYPSPIWDTVQDTHDNYNACVRTMLAEVANNGAEVMVASHNQRSVELAVAEMARLGLSPTHSGVYFGQLLGMADNLTYLLGHNGYQAYKYVPYGPVEMVMPFLIRRAQENSQIVGDGVRKQLNMLQAELGARLLGSSGSSTRKAATA